MAISHPEPGPLSFAHLAYSINPAWIPLPFDIAWVLEILSKVYSHFSILVIYFDAHLFVAAPPC